MTGPTLLVVVALAIAACGSAQPSSAKPADVCAPPAEPGPADEPPREDAELDTTDYGGARWRLCLAEPIGATAEETAWCIWTQDRTAVLEIDGQRARIGAVEYFSSLSIARNEFQLHTTVQGSAADGNYEPAQVVPVGDATDDGRSGNLTFDVVLRPDPEVGAPAGAPPRYAGSMSWQCGDPPPPG